MILKKRFRTFYERFISLKGIPRKARLTRPKLYVSLCW